METLTDFYYELFRRVDKNNLIHPFSMSMNPFLSHAYLFTQNSSRIWSFSRQIFASGMCDADNCDPNILKYEYSEHAKNPINYLWFLALFEKGFRICMINWDELRVVCCLIKCVNFIKKVRSQYFVGCFAQGFEGRELTFSIQDFL